MTLYDPFTFILITVLLFAVSGELAVVLVRGHERDCQASNSLLQAEQREGPLQRCE